MRSCINDGGGITKFVRFLISTDFLRILSKKRTMSTREQSDVHFLYKIKYRRWNVTVVLIKAKTPGREPLPCQSFFRLEGRTHNNILCFTFGEPQYAVPRSQSVAILLGSSIRERKKTVTYFHIMTCTHISTKEGLPQELGIGYTVNPRFFDTLGVEPSGTISPLGSLTQSKDFGNFFAVPLFGC